MKKSCIPNIFTFINLSCGVLSILSTHEGNYLVASIFILLAGLVDRYDGRVARFLNVSSELGKELDSLADLVSFGVAPSILMYLMFNLRTLGPYGIIGIIILLTVPICGAFRLARYNTSSFDGVFTGIPITIIGCLLSLIPIISLWVTIPLFIIVILMLLGSYLMVSTLHLKKI
ncbi:MAG: CDP-diacylglycerol--serine O-phosphatidyltransferase [Clostridium sp.]|nr:CDP-diacylglycerol--serine O-phosphatidyltransferase [Clostridium sp.]